MPVVFIEFYNLVWIYLKKKNSVLPVEYIGFMRTKILLRLVHKMASD